MKGNTEFWPVVRRIIKYVGLLVVFLFVGSVIYFWPTISNIARWNPIITPLWVNITGSVHKDTLQARLADLDAFEYFVKLDRSFNEAQIDLFLKSLNEAKKNVNVFSDAEFVAEIYRLAAISENGHSGASHRWLVSNLPQVPVQLYWFGPELRIIRTHKKYQEILGGRVLAINGITIDDLFQQLRPFLTGIENHEKIISSVFLVRPFFLRGAGLGQSENSLSLSIQMDEEESLDVTLLADHNVSIQGPLPRYPWHYLVGEPLLEENGEWLSVGSSWVETPTYLIDVTKLHHWELMQAGTVLYIRLLLSLNLNSYNLKNFWQEVGAIIDREVFDKIIFDYRYNPGGDLTLSRDFLTGLSDRVATGTDIFVLSNPSTFSAAIVGVAHIKGNTELDVTHIGEPVGDSGAFWAETGLPLRLPNSGIRIRYATGYHDWVKGCAGQHPHCYSESHKEVNIESLEPDVLVPLSFEDYHNGKDPVIDFVLSR